jgi:hypothetical protein
LVADDVWWNDLYADPEKEGQPKDPTWGDVGKQVAAGVADVGAHAQAAVRRGAERFLEPAAKIIDSNQYTRAAAKPVTDLAAAVGEGSKLIQKLSNLAADEIRDSASDVAKERVGAAVTSPEFWEHPGSAALLKAAGMTPAIASMLFTGPVIGAAIGGTLSAGEFLNDTEKHLDQTSDADLRKNDWYNQAREMGMDEADARTELKRRAIGNKDLATFVIGSVANAFGPAAKVAGKISGTAAPTLAAEGSSRLARAGIGALEGAASEIVDEGQLNMAKQFARMDVDPKAQFKGRELIDVVAEGALFGAGFGGAAGAVTGGRAQPKGATVADAPVDAPPPIQTVDAGNAPSADQAAALAAEQAPARPATAGEVAPEINPLPAPPPVAEPQPEVSPQPVAETPPASAPAPQMAPPVAVPDAETSAAQVPPDQSSVPAAPQPVEAPTDPTIAPPTGRILRPVTPEAIAREEAINENLAPRIEAEQEAAREAAEIAARAAKAPQGKNLGPKALAAIAKDVESAKTIANAHMPAANEDAYLTDLAARKAVRARATAMVAAAKEAGLKTTRLRASIQGNQRADDPNFILLREATELAKVKATGKALTDKVNRFKLRELRLRAGDVSEILAERRAEGEAFKRRHGGDEAIERAAGDHTGMTAAGSLSAAGAGGGRATETEVVAAPVKKIPVTDDVKAKALAALQVAANKAKGAELRAVEAGVEAPVTPKVTPKVAAAKKIAEKPKAKPPALAKREFDQEVKAAVETDATPAQKEAGNYAKAHLKIGDMEIAIENPRGSKREGVSPSGRKWSVKMPDHYGYIKDTKGADGDKLDVTLGPKAYPGSKVLDEVNVYVIHQKDLETDKFDEHKVFLGFDTQEKAELSYDNSFSDGRGMKRIQKVEVLTPAEFKAWRAKRQIEAATTKAKVEPKAEPKAEPAPAPKPEAKAEAAPAPKAEAPQKTADELELEKLIAEQQSDLTQGLGKELPALKHSGVEVPHVAAMSAKDVLARLPIDHLTGVPRTLAGLLKTRFQMLAGDIPVYVYRKDNFARIVGDESVNLEADGEGFRGAHNINEEGRQLIFLRLDALNDPKEAARAVLHEISHGATVRALFEDNRIHHFTTELLKEVTAATRDAPKETKDIVAYALKNPREFIAEGHSNSDFQNLLAQTPISHKLAQSLNLDTRRPTSAWDAFISIVRRALERVTGSLPQGHTALDALLRLSEHMEVHRKRQLSLERKFGGPLPFDIRGATDIQASELTDALTRADVQTAAADTGTNIAGRIRRGADRASSVFMLEQRSAPHFGESQPVKALFRERAAMENAKDEILKTGGGAQATRDWAAYRRKDPTNAAVAAELGFDLSNQNINPTSTNTHLGVDATHGWQAKSQEAALKARFNALPEEAKALLTRTAEMFRRAHNDVSLQLIKNILATADVNVPGLAERIHTNSLTQADRDMYLGDKSQHIVKALNEAREIKEIQGWYFPFRRYGEFTSSGNVKFETPTNAIRISDDTVQFTGATGAGDTAVRRAAKAFVQAPGQLKDGAIKHVYVDARDPTKLIEKEDANAIHAYRVTLRNQHVEFHETEAEARAAEADYVARGMVNTSSGKLDPNDQKMSVDTSNRMDQLLRALERQDRFKAMDSNEQAALRQSLRETMISAMGSTHLKSTFHQRRNVAGMSQDMGRVVADYSRMSANYLAKLRHQPKIDELFRQMSDYAKANRFDGNRLRRDELIATLKERIYNSNADDHLKNSFINNATTRLLQVTRLARLAGVSFHVINSQEPWTTSLPVIGGRHGFSRTSKALVEAYNTIGARGGVMAGFKDTAKAYNNDSGFTDYVEVFKANIANNPMLGGGRAKRLAEVLDYVAKLNLFSEGTKFEVSRYADPTGNVVGRAFDRADLMANQVGSAIEGINRAVTTLAAYELEFRKNGGNHEAAMSYAYDTAHLTMGDYSAWNAAPIFNTTGGRLALQFKKFGHKMYYLLGKTMLGTLKGDPEATKQFVGLMVTHAMVAGALGLPIEPFKVALLAANAVGLTGFSGDDFEDTVRRLAASVLGKTGGEVFTHGLPRAIGIDTSSRQGLDSLMTFGAPKTNKSNDIKSWLFDTMAGAPVGYLMDQVASAQALMKGDVTTALEKTIPIRAATDVVKAVDGISGPKLNDDGRERRPALTVPQAAVRALGFTPSVVTENYKKNVAFAKATKEQSQQRAEFMAAWVKASPSERLRLWGRIELENRRLPAEAKITRKALDAYVKRRKDEEGAKINGLRAGRANKHIAKQLDYYNTN